MTERRMLAAIMFTDIEGYTRLMHEREGLALDSLRAHNKVFDELSFKYSGLVVKSVGDSYLIEFPSAVNAVQCALDAQEAFAERNVDLPEQYRLKVRISIHVGDVVMDNDDVYGDGVNVASRLQSVTPGGAICLSRDAYAQIKTKLGRRFSSLGAVTLKGLPEPVEAFLNNEAAPQAEGAVKMAALNVVLPDTPPQVAPEPQAHSASAKPFGPGERQAAAAAAPLPEPPPAPAIGPSGPTAATYAVFSALFALFFGKPWLSTVHADWLACGWAAAIGAAVLMQAEDLSSSARWIGTLLVADAAFAFYQVGSGGFSFEMMLAGGLGVVTAGAAVYLGLFASQRDRKLSGGMVLAATALLTVAGCARALPENVELLSGLGTFLREQLRSMGDSGGAWRWAGFSALYVAWRLADLSSFDPADWSRGAMSKDGRRINWNL